MLVESLNFHCAFTGDAILPPFKGSTLRGAFGYALKKITCALPRMQCADCILAASCCYSLVFESEKLDRNRAGYAARLAAKPHPYVLEPPVDDRSEYAAGDTFSFTLHLFGPALSYRPQILYAVNLMGEAGLGRQHQGTFAVNMVTAGGKTIYDGETRTLSLEDASWSLAFEPAPGEDACSRVNIALCTPFRVKRANSFVREFDFGTLVRAAMRRVSALENAYGDGEPEVDYRALARLADAVRVVTDETAWLDIGRYSSRQRQPMKIGGIVGMAEVEGDLGPVLPFLRYCETVHLGKQTAFGLGLIRVNGQ